MRLTTLRVADGNWALRQAALCLVIFSNAKKNAPGRFRFAPARGKLIKNYQAFEMVVCDMNQNC